VPGHGFHPLKARLSWSIPNPQDVHRQGRTPSGGQNCTPNNMHDLAHGKGSDQKAGSCLSNYKDTAMTQQFPSSSMT
jgi:hypothetical protein